MKKVFVEQFISSAKSIAPITVIIVILSVLLSSNALSNTIPIFLVSALLLVCGMTLFNIGAEISMVEIGSRIGNHLTKRRNVPLILILSFIIGFIITIAEPDLRVLASQVSSISSETLIMVVGVGVGVFLLISTFRILFQLNYSVILTLFCIIAFVLAFFTPSEFVPLAFDSGGVTTGPLSVPFIVALGAGLSLTRRDKNKKDDSFGMISLCSIGPIIVVLLLGIVFNAQSSYTPYEVIKFNGFQSVLDAVFKGLPKYFVDVSIALLPILIFFLLYNVIFLKINKQELRRILAGLIFTYIGLSIFLTGVNIGFMPTGYLIGKAITTYGMFVVPVAMLVGFFVVASEPAIGVLTLEIEEITNGNIKRKVLNVALAIAISIATGLSILRIVYDIPIMWFLLPIYAIALILSLYVPKIFTSIAFDSGGVASGTMTATFLLPFAVGIAEQLERNVLTDAFGLIALVASTPLIVVQIVGLIYKYKTKTVDKLTDVKYNEEIIDY